MLKATFFSTLWLPLPEKGVRVYTSYSIPFFIAHTKYLTSDSLAFTWFGHDTYA